MCAAAHQRAAAATGPRSAAVAALLDDALDDATRAAVRPLLAELAAALRVEPKQHAHQGAAE
eukprot:5038321-Prymnesium_polylepis.1